MEASWKKRIQRPIGVYIWTILIFINFGILGFLKTFSEVRKADGDVSLPLVVIAFGLCLFTAGAAIWAFTGANEGRIALLILLPLNLLWVLLLAVSALLDDDPSNDKPAVEVIIRTVIASLWIIAIEWYFLTGKVVEYYKQNE